MNEPGGEASCDGLGTGVGGVFEDGAMAVWSCGDHANVVVGVLDGGNNPRGKDELLPCLPDVNDVDTCTEKKICRESASEGLTPKQTHRLQLPPLPDVGLHLLITVLGANVALCSERELDVLLRCT